MAARTSRGGFALRTVALLIVLTLTSATQADDDHWALVAARFRMAVFLQDGTGYQSQDGPVEGPGSEELLVLQPMMQLGVRQGPRVRHDVTLAVDAVSSASADALDAVSRASLWNEAATLGLQSTIRVTDDDIITTKVFYHQEEPLLSVGGGVGYTRELADDNATLSLNANVLADWFDPLTPQGLDLGYTNRQTLNANVSFSQTLSRTTLLMLGYGLTHQRGTLEQTWNAVPVSDRPVPTFERFPDRRLRHAASVRLFQHVPATRSTLRGRYRLYRDDFGVVGHSSELQLWQPLVPWLTTRLHYRFHRQSAVSFWQRAVDSDAAMRDTPRTADSDLAAFDAHEAGLVLRFQLSDALGPRGDESIDVSYLRYQRTTGLTMNVWALSYARIF